MGDSKKRKSFVFYDSFLEVTEELPREDQLDFLTKIIRFALFGEEPEFDSLATRMTFKVIRPVIETSNNRYQACVNNGKKGGAPKGNKNRAKSKEKQPDNKPKIKPDVQPEFNLNYNYNDNENYNENYNSNENDNYNQKNDKSADASLHSPSGDGNAPDGHSAPSGNTPVSKSGINWQEMTWQEEFELFEKYFNEQIEKYHLREVVTEEGAAYLSNEILCPYTKEEMRDAFRRGMDFKEYHEWDGMEDNT